MLWLCSDLGESLKAKRCLAARSLPAVNPDFLHSDFALICRLQEVGEHVSRHGLQQHLGDAGCHDLWTKGHRRCHDIAERISADLPKVSLVVGEKRKEERRSNLNFLRCYCLLCVLWFRFRKKSGFMETIATFWYGQPTENSTEGRQGASTTTSYLLWMSSWTKTKCMKVQLKPTHAWHSSMCGWAVQVLVDFIYVHPCLNPTVIVLHCTMASWLSNGRRYLFRSSFKRAHLNL